MRQLLLNVDREMNELGLICKSTCLSVAKKKKSTMQKYAVHQQVLLSESIK